jgi:Methane oxygenase PmoA
MHSFGTGRVLAPLAMSVILATQFAAAEVTVEPSEKGAVVKIDGKAFAEYLKRSGHQPAVWPVIGPTGKAMTRSYPAGPLLPGEMEDHPHHHSIWFTHGNVNGRDFWTNHEQSKQDSEIRHRDFVATESGEVGKIVTRNDWISGGKKVCEDERTLLFGENEFGRFIDFLVTIVASEGDITFGETKEGAFGVRTNAPLTVDAKQGAHITNNRGDMDADAWGKFATWIDDYGPVDGEVLGIAMFNHPDNFRHPTRWHARTYGLLAANPFGEGEFPKDDGGPKQGPKTIKQGDKLTLRYRVLLHSGDPKEANIDKAYEAFIAK